MTEEELVKLIEESFPPYGLDGGVSMSQAALADDWVGCDTPQYQEAYQKDVTSNWREVTHYDGFLFSYLDPKGMRYYLPVALREVVTAKIKSVADIPFDLLPESPSDPTKYQNWSPTEFIERNGFNGVQANCITKVLNFIFEYDTDGFDAHDKFQLAKWNQLYGKEGT